MALKIGNNAVTNAFVGSSQVRRAYKGGTLVYQGWSPVSEQEFIRQEATGGPAQLLKVYGKTIVNNQLVEGGSGSHSIAAAAFSFSDFAFTLTTGHKVLISFYGQNVSGRRFNCQNGSGSIVAISSFAPSSDGQFAQIFSTIASGRVYLMAINSAANPSIVNDFFAVDLTQRFGAGNEPTSVDEALRLLGGDAFDPAYDPGSLQSNKTSLLRAERIPVINVWDEEWVHGRYTTDTGEAAENASMVRNKNRISIIPNSTYYVAQPGASGLYLYLYFYDLEGNFIGKIEGIVPNRTFTPTAGAAFMNFFYYKAGGLTTMPATSFNLSDPAINGTYYSHWRGSLTLNLSTLTGKLNGEGASVAVFPDGLRCVGSIRDEAEGSTAVQRIGSRAYQAGDESDTSVLTDGTNTIYPLATPQTYTLDTPLPTDLTCEQGDILQRVSDNNCPFVGEMRFGL